MTTTTIPAPPVAQETIESFVKRHGAAADFEALRDTAARASKLGFNSAANGRLVEFWQDFQPDPRLKAHYEEAYPSSFFLPWKALHRTLDTLKLWLEPAENYTGAIPGEQLPWLEIFELQPDDEILPTDAKGLTGRYDRLGDVLTGAAIMYRLGTMATATSAVLNYERQVGDDWHYATAGSRATEMLQHPGNRGMRDRLIDAWSEATRKLFVVAPPEAFKTDMDWLERLSRMVDAQNVVKVAPDDPLVIRFCRGGALVVAAWGDEAAELNAVARELNV